MDHTKRICAAVLCVAFLLIVSGAAVIPNDKVVFYADDTDVGLGDKIEITIKAKNVPENGMSAALIGLRYDKRLKFERSNSSINLELKGNKTIGTKDIDVEGKNERRFMWVDDSGGIKGDFVFATAVFAVPEGIEAGTVFEFELSLSGDPKNYLDGGSSPITVTSEGFTVTVRDFESPMTLAVGEASFDGAFATVPVTLSNVENVRGGLSSAGFALKWTGNAILSSVSASEGSAVVSGDSAGVAAIGWSSITPVKSDLTFNCCFDLSGCTSPYNTAIEPILSEGSAFNSAGGVDQTDRIEIISGEIMYEFHTLEYVPASDPGCETTGCIAHYRCKDCGRLFADADAAVELDEADVIISASGHAWGDWTLSVEADCVNPGEEKRVCANDPTHVETRPTDPLGHILGHFDAVEPTAEANGNIEYWKCSRCGGYFTDAEARFETDAAGIVAVFEPGEGDVNGDGYVNARDVELLLRYLTGWTRENYPALAAFRADLADLNDDGVLTARDSWLLAEKVVGRAVHNAEATVGEYGNDGAPRGADVITEIKGDTNGDGKVNAKDVVALMKAVVFGDPSLLMDLNGDGRINAKDVVTLMKLIVTTLATEPTLHTDVDIDDFPQSYNDFISGAVFCGDSICWLMSHYGVLPEENVVAAIGAGVFSIRMQEIFPFTVDGVECSFDEAIITRDPKRIVLWIGINDCGYTLDRFLYGYGELLEALKEDAPNAQIYVMSIAPIGDAASVVEKYGVTNETVDGMNRAIAGVCEEHGATFVDVSTALKDDNNKLSDEFFASDGLHLPVNAYEVVLKTFLHTVLGD